MQTKVCSKCKLEKVVSDFLPRTKRPKGQRYSSCKICKAAHTRRRYRERREDGDTGYWSWLMLRSIRKRAKAKGWECSLSPEEIHERVLEADGLCSYCGREMDFFAGYKNRKNGPSVDRLDPEQGYVSENIVICCYRCNAVKNDATPAELRALADAVDLHLSLRKKVHGRSTQSQPNGRNLGPA